MEHEGKCFVISPIGEEGTPVRERSNNVLEYVIEPALEPYDYEPVRADNIQEPGMITTQVIERVVECPLVIADLTGSNPNVFYELAVRHAYNKPFIQLIDKDENIPFDVADSRIIQFDVDETKSAHKAQEEIQDQIQTIESNEDFRADNPISVATDLKDLRNRGTSEGESLADIKESIAQLRNSMTSMQNRLNDPEEILPPDYFEYMATQVELDDKEKVMNELMHIRQIADKLTRSLDQDDIDKEVSKLPRDIVYMTTQLMSDLDNRLVVSDEIDDYDVHPKSDLQSVHFTTESLDDF
jgi:hypothetical protein